MKKLNIHSIFKLINFSLVISALLYTIIATAASLPRNYPDSFMWAGKIEEISASSQKIIIEDREFVLSPTIVVTRLKSGSSAALSDLPVGLVVGCNHDGNGVITGIWELPEDFAGHSGTSLSRRASN